jgi:hypothetical protein
VTEASFDNSESATDVCDVLFCEIQAPGKIADARGKVMDTFIEHGKTLAKGAAVRGLISGKPGPGPETEVVVVFGGVPLHVDSHVVDVQTRYRPIGPENMRILTSFSSEKNALRVGRKGEWWVVPDSNRRPTD